MKSKFEESSFIYLQESIVTFEGSRLEIIQSSPSKDFELLVSYSYDRKNFSQFVPYPTSVVVGNTIPVYICIWVRRIVHNDLKRLEGKIIKKFENVENHSAGYDSQLNTAICVIDEIRYNQKVIDKLKFSTLFDIVDEFPRWNYYDKQQVNVIRWLSQCNAIAESYGHTVIYFKTEPNNSDFREDSKQSGIHGTHHTLVNNVIRDVVEVKKLHIMVPGNELPQDRVAFTEWDIALQDDFMIHVVRERFERAWGGNEIPNEKDFIYFPLINKMFRVGTMQPKNGFMGVIGWYEVFLQKYENDDHVRLDRKIIPETLKGSFLTDSDNGFFDVISDLEDQPNFSEIVQELEGITQPFENDEERIVEERKATNNFSNRLVDSTNFVSLKETEKHREFYHHRLKIVSVNADSNATTPLMMYDCDVQTKGEKNGTILKYNCSKLHSVENFIQLSFDYVLLSRYNGVIFETDLYSISIKNRKLIIEDYVRDEEFVIFGESKLNLNELYQIGIEYVSAPMNKLIDREEVVSQNAEYFEGYIFKLYQAFEGSKSLVDQNVWLLSEFKTGEVRMIENGYIFAGSCFIGNIRIVCDNNIILEDKCLPLLKMQQF